MSIIASLFGVGAGFLKQGGFPQRPATWDEASSLFQAGKTLPEGSPEREATFEEACDLFLVIADEAEGDWSGEALMMAGLGRSWQNDHLAAIRCYEKALDVYSDHSGTAVYVYLAQSLQALGRTLEAEARAQEFLDIAQGRAVPAWQIGAANQVLGNGVGDGSEAVAAFERGKDAGDPEARRDAMEEAERLFLEALEGEVGFRRGHGLMMCGLCRAWLDDHEAAVEYYEEALVEMDGLGDRATRAYLAQSLVDLGRLDEAQAHARQVLASAQAAGQAGWTVDAAERLLALTPETAADERLKHEAWDAFCRGKEAETLAERSEAMAEAEGLYLAYAQGVDGNDLAATLMMAGVCRDWVGDAEGALAHYDEALETAVGRRYDILAYSVMSAVQARRFDLARERAGQLGREEGIESQPDWVREQAALAEATDELLEERRMVALEMWAGDERLSAMKEDIEAQRATATPEELQELEEQFAREKALVSERRKASREKLTTLAPE